MFLLHCFAWERCEGEGEASGEASWDGQTKPKERTKNPPVAVTTGENGVGGKSEAPPFPSQCS